MWKGVSDSKEEAPIVPSTNNYLAFGSSMQECSLIFWSASLIMHFCLGYVGADMVHIVRTVLHVANMISALQFRLSFGSASLVEIGPIDLVRPSRSFRHFPM